MTSTAPPSSLDSADYNPIDHLNQIFSHPSTLSSIPAVSSNLRIYQDDLSADIGRLVSIQTASNADSVKRIQATKAELAELFKKIENVRARAIETELAITEMTADIKRLDNAKRNLTLSMTALKRLQMLTTAYEQLRGLSKTRQYRECAQLLQAVIQLMAHFKSYRSIDQIATLSRNVSDLQRELLEQVCEDFELAFARGEVQQKKAMLGEACLVMDALGDNARARLVTWYCNTQLREYRQVFKGNDEAGSLDNISRRYSWFNRMLKTYDAEHAVLFPPHWRVNEMLANAFCEGTRDDFKGILQRSARRTDGQTLDVNLLLSCLQETLNFEHSLERRFAGEPRPSVDTVTSIQEKSNSFGQAISEAFEPYLSLWVESQDKQLSSYVARYRTQPMRNPDEEFNAQLVIPSSTELFTQYRLIFAQCAKLSTGSRLLELSKTFAKYLDQYSQQVLFYFLSEKPGAQGPSIEDTILILNTADYCYGTCSQLEEKIKAKIDAEFRDGIDLQSQADSFMGIASAAVRVLVRKVEVDCEPAWREMRNMPWSKLESVGDQSGYVGELLRRINERSSEILRYLHKQQYARAFCDNVVEAVSNTYIMTLTQCRPISEVGAEQMLLDSYSLKKVLTELSVINSEPGTQPSASYVKRVNATMAKIDPLLKTLQVRSSPPEGLVQAYLICIKDRSDANFRKILELKGVTRKAEQASLLELFQAHRSSPAHEQNLVQNSPILTPLVIGPTAGVTVGAGAASHIPGIASLGNAASLSTPALSGTRFDPTTLGSALMSAARDGVDRLGSPALGTSATGSLSASSSPPPAGADGHVASNLNENLKNIGKFFRRDVSGFGRFGKQAEDGKS